MGDLEFMLTAHACAVSQKEQRTNAKVWILMENTKHTVQGAVKRMYKQTWKHKCSALKRYIYMYIFDF